MVYYGDSTYYNSDFSHYGVKGMKWGVRKQRVNTNSDANRDQNSHDNSKNRKVMKGLATVAAVTAIATATYYTKKNPDVAKKLYGKVTNIRVTSANKNPKNISQIVYKKNHPHIESSSYRTPDQQRQIDRAWQRGRDALNKQFDDIEKEVVDRWHYLYDSGVKQFKEDQARAEAQREARLRLLREKKSYMY